MPVRSTMAAHIAKVRLLVADTGTGAAQVFADQDVQDVLDERRRDVFLTISREQVTVAGPPTSGSVSWLDYFADGGWWEADVKLQDYTYKTLTASTTPVSILAADYVVGHWTFASTDPQGLLPPLFLTGKQYDVYAAAADLLEMWLARVKLDFDFLAAGRTFKRHQQVTGIETLIERYRRRQWVGVSQMVRTDMAAVRADAY